MDKSGLNLITSPFYITSVTYPKIIVGWDDPHRHAELVPQDVALGAIKPSAKFQDHITGLHCSLFDVGSLPDGKYLATSLYRAADDKIMEREVVALVKDGEVVEAIQVKRG